MPTRMMTVKDRHGDDVERIVYDVDSLLIEDILLWSESAQDFRSISVWQFKAQELRVFDLLEKKIVQHNLDYLTGERERCDEDSFENHRETGGI